MTDSTPARVLFTSRGRTAVVDADGGGLRWLDFDVPDQVTWQPAGFFPDGRVLLLSMAARRDGPGRPFGEYYHQTPTHLWIHDLASGALEEILTRQRLAPFVTPQLILDAEGLVIQVVRDGRGQSLDVNLDGTGARQITGDVPAIWVARADGGDPRLLARGLDGADHPRWVPSPA